MSTTTDRIDMRIWPIAVLAVSLCAACSIQTDTYYPPTSTPTSTATSIPTSTPIPTAIPTATCSPVPPTSSPTPMVLDYVPRLPECKSQAPYKIISYRPGHDLEMQIVQDAAQEWEDMTGINLFDDDSSSIIAVMFDGDPECVDNSVMAATFPGTAEKPYAAFIWLCAYTHEFLADRCVSPQHELGHVLCLVDNYTPKSTGIMSVFMGHDRNDPVSYEEWCHNPILPKEAQVVRELNMASSQEYQR